MKKYMKGLLLTSICLLFGLTIYAQTNPLDNKYTPPENSIFSGSSNKSSNANFDFPKNSVLLRASELARQEAIFQYERFLFEPLALSVSIGFPFGKDYIEAWSSEMGEKDGSDYVSIFTLNSISDVTSGFIWGSNLKIYPSYAGDNAEVFIELAYKNSIKTNKITESRYSNREFQTSLNYFGLSLGSKMSSNAKKIKFTHEISYGFGMKVVKWENYKMDIRIDPITSNASDYYYKTSSEGKYAFVYFSFKYNLGFAF